MQQANYIKLNQEYPIKVTDDEDSPTVNADVLKIVKVNGLDENTAIPRIEIYYNFGYINNKGIFVSLERSLHYDFICDVEEKLINEKPTGFGINPATRQKDLPGNWLSNILSIKQGQGNRAKGDFRMIDLYEYLIKKLNIQGEILCEK